MEKMALSLQTVTVIAGVTVLAKSGVTLAKAGVTQVSLEVKQVPPRCHVWGSRKSAARSRIIIHPSAHVNVTSLLQHTFHLHTQPATELAVACLSQPFLRG